MTRIFSEGFEMGDAVSFDNNPTASVQSTTKRSGTYALRGGGGTNGFSYSLATGVAELYVRFAFLKSENADGKLLRWDIAGTETGSLRIGSNKMQIYTGSSTLSFTGTIPILYSTWYLVEMHIKIADSGGVLEYKIDGVQDGVGVTGDTKPSTGTLVDRISFMYGNNYTTFDDIAINDVNGTSENSWPGDGHIIAISPDSNGDSSGLLGSDGNRTDNYALVDETPPASADYVEGIVGSGWYDLYGLGACGLTSPTIIAVWAEARGADTVAAGSNVNLGVKDAGAEYWGSNQALLTTYTKALYGTRHVINPTTSGVWTTAEIDALQGGVKVP